MTAVMFILATRIRTPTVLWLVAMICDTAMIVTYMLLYH
jgi:hypothetical protein